MSDNNKLKSLGQEIKECILSKWIGCFIALVAVVLSIAQAIAYGFFHSQDFHAGALVCSILAAVSFLALSLFKKTTPLAPVALMVFDFLAMCLFFSKIIDYFSTVFFDGFSAAKFFAQDGAYWFCIISFILTTIISFVAMYVPQSREKANKAEVESNEIKEV